MLSASRLADSGSGARMLGLLTKVDERSLRRHFIWSAEHMDVAQALLPRLMLGSPHRALHRCEQVNRVLAWLICVGLLLFATAQVFCGRTAAGSPAARLRARLLTMERRRGELSRRSVQMHDKAVGRAAH